MWPLLQSMEVTDAIERHSISFHFIFVILNFSVHYQKSDVLGVGGFVWLYTGNGT